MFCRHCGQPLRIDKALDAAVGPDGSDRCPGSGAVSDWDAQYRATGIDPLRLPTHSSACGCDGPRVHAPSFGPARLHTAPTVTGARPTLTTAGRAPATPSTDQRPRQ
jgi:hypothetical protein